MFGGVPVSSFFALCFMTFGAFLPFFRFPRDRYRPPSLRKHYKGSAVVATLSENQNMKGIEMKTQCPHCREIYDVESDAIGKQATCPGCGKEFLVVNYNLAPCPDCGALISKRVTVCPKCGAPLRNAETAPFANSNSSASMVDISDEKELAVYSPSVMGFLLVIIFITIPLFCFGAFLSLISVTVGIISMLLGLVLFIFLVFSLRCTHYKITTHRIIVICDWFIAKSQREIWIKDMRGASMSQGIWQRIVGVGNIAIGTAATAGTEISMISIKNPEDVVKQINSLRHF